MILWYKRGQGEPSIAPHQSHHWIFAEKLFKTMQLEKHKVHQPRK